MSELRRNVGDVDPRDDVFQWHVERGNQDVQDILKPA